MNKETVAFACVLLATLALSAILYAGGGLSKVHKPEIISDSPGELDVAKIIGIVLAGTGILVVAKLLGLTLRLFVEAGAFSGCYYFASIFLRGDWGILAGLFGIALRATPFIFFLNITAIISIVSFALIFGSFLSWKLVLLTISAMAIYDALAVLYTKHMKFLWLGSYGFFGGKVANPRWRETFALFFPGKPGEPVSIIGAGDFALPAMFVASIASSGSYFAGTVSVVFLVFSFMLLEKISAESEKTLDTGMPGIPPIALGASVSAMLLSSLGLIS